LALLIEDNGRLITEVRSPLFFNKRFFVGLDLLERPTRSYPVMASEAPISCSMVVASTLSASENVCHGIMSRLQDCGFSREDLFAVHLALQEAFINAVRHGNKMDPNKQVKIEYSIASDKVEITIADDGDGFDPQAVPDPRCGENLYKPGGRGLLLMCSYMDVVQHNRQGNSVSMVRYKERPPLTENLRRKQA